MGEKREVTKVAEKVKEVLGDCPGVVDVRVIPYCCIGGDYIVLVEAESLGGSMNADFALDDAFGKQYVTYSKVDGVHVRVSTVGSEMHQ